MGGTALKPEFLATAASRRLHGTEATEKRLSPCRCASAVGGIPARAAYLPTKENMANKSDVFACFDLCNKLSEMGPAEGWEFRFPTN